MPPPVESSSSDLRRLLLQSLASWREAGVRQLPRGQAMDIDSPAAEPSPSVDTSPSPRYLAGQAAAEVTRPTVALPPSSPASAATPPQNMLNEPLPPRVADPAAELKILEQEVSGCTRCTELATTRTQTVFGVGNPRARLAFFGEAPGADEDARGEPFVGRAGQLLTKIIEACTLSRQEVYILNTLKCRPPGNRNPSSEEAANCRGYFEKQLELIQPEYLCCLGSVAAQNVLDTTMPIGKLRGKFHDYRGIKVIATYHPAYLLRNPSAKRQVWEDMQMLMKAMGIKLPTTQEHSK